MRFAKGAIEVRVHRIPKPFPTSVYAVTVWPLIDAAPSSRISTLRKKCRLLPQTRGSECVGLKSPLLLAPGSRAP